MHCIGSASPILVVLTQVPRKADRYEPAALELADHISSRKLPLSGPVFLINAQKNTFNGTPQHGLDELLDETFRIAPRAWRLTGSRIVPLSNPRRRGHNIIRRVQ